MDKWTIISGAVKPAVMEFFSVQDRRLWERAFEASINGAVRAEEAVESDIAAIGIAKPNLVAEPGMGNVMQNECLR